MALTGIKFCKPSVVDTKKQNSRPIFQPLRLLSSATSTMHQTKNHDFPFVTLTGHKLVDDPPIPSSFDIMDDHTNEEDFSFVKSNNFTNARAIFKNASLKGCHQFPMISISQLVGGFVGSKSQVRAKNRESHQIWDIVFQKLDQFVNSRPVERYSEHCYEFQALSQNLIGSLYEESRPNSALDFAASYILADGGRSFKNTKPTSNIAKSSPTTQQPVQIIPPPVDTFVSLNPVLPSHSPSNPSVILDIVEHLISQSDLSNHDVILPDPVKFTHVAHSVSTSSTLEPSALRNILSEQPLDKDTLSKKPSLVSSEVKQSYAEVAKMAHRRSTIDNDHKQTRSKSSSKRHRKVKNHYFVRSCNDARQRCADLSNWRDRAGSSELKDLRRDPFTLAHSGVKSAVHAWRCEQKSESAPKRISEGHRRKKHDGLKYPKPCIALKTVPEFTTSSAKEVMNQAESSACSQSSQTVHENSCQFYNPHKRSCMNWRCRQHCQKSSAKRNMRYILMDNIVGDHVDGQTPNSDTSPSPNENSDIRINSFERYITMLPSNQPSPNNSDGSTVVTRGRSNSKSSVQSLPSIAPGGEHTQTLTTRVHLKDDDVLNVLKRPRSLSETMDFCVKTLQTAKERSLSESGESIKSVPRSRSISEESKPNSLSSSSISSSSSCKLISEANLRRRFSSECDSEDSFVIFEGGLDCLDYDSSDDSSTSNDSSDESGGSESDDEVDAACPRVSMVFCIPAQTYDDFDNSAQSAKLRELNARWDVQQCRPTPEENSATPCKKVQFAQGPGLATVHCMVKWDYAYRSARCGHWEEMARDRERFKQRVERSEPVLSLVLTAAHRDEILRRLDAAGRHDAPLG